MPGCGPSCSICSSGCQAVGRDAMFSKLPSHSLDWTALSRLRGKSVCRRRARLWRPRPSCRGRDLCVRDIEPRHRVGPQRSLGRIWLYTREEGSIPHSALGENPPGGRVSPQIAVIGNPPQTADPVRTTALASQNQQKSNTRPEMRGDLKERLLSREGA